LEISYEGTSARLFFFEAGENADASVKVTKKLKLSAFEASPIKFAIYFVSQSDSQFILSTYLLSRQPTRKSSSVGHDG
jgi:hypothetical protein